MIVPKNRPTWDEYFLEFARVASSRSTCPRAHVGSLVVVENRIIATGYNGSAPGQPHCTDIGCQQEDGHCQQTLHAEVNAIGQCAQFGVPCRGATLYIYFEKLTSGNYPEPIPGCRECNKVIRAAAIHRVVTLHGDHNIAVFNL